ncbi:MAG: ZIP family metal transporter [Candidatus Woesearchaeota archaeon]
MVLANILIATVVVSLISFVGAVVLFFHRKYSKTTIFYLVSFSTGALLAAAFLDLLPEAAEHGGENAFIFVLGSIIIFFLLEKYVYWYHCHYMGVCKVHDVKAFKYINLVGDSLHNFIDGTIIAASFLVSTNLGIVSSIAIILHEIPQELGDFAILLHGGFTKAKALFFNFLSGLTAIIGASLVYFAEQATKLAEPVLLAIAAGSFIYLAVADLLPELHKETRFEKSSIQFALLLIGILVMWAVGSFFTH